MDSFVAQLHFNFSNVFFKNFIYHKDIQLKIKFSDLYPSRLSKRLSGDSTIIDPVCNQDDKIILYLMTSKRSQAGLFFLFRPESIRL